MARPTKYHTPEEKIAANRAKSKKHYESHQKSINKKRRKTYAKSHPSSSSLGTCFGESPSLAVPKAQSASENWFELVTRTQARLQKLTGNDHVKFVDDLYSSFIKTNNKEPIHQVTIALDKMQTNMYKYQDKILNLDGMTTRYHTTEALTKVVCNLIQWVEEVFCYAIIGVAEVMERYSERKFEFQGAQSDESAVQ
ncbi:hypothetical protein BDN70DRAFT_901553 [Pholiota conissans]|uniref:Uncharacterized protein n=1 Tax=Pholiota conissans TaxID=109636 RepID=A0A9P5YMA7_9AGAR|nr:hypothetical protein BDN70DRAFT_901553 [Pholiota conissans]